MLLHGRIRSTLPFVLALLFWMPALHASEPVRVRYDLSHPVEYTNTLQLEVQESLPILKLKSQGTQKLTFEVKRAVGTDSTSPVRLPIDLNVILNDFSVKLGVNGSELSYEADGDKVSAPLIQLSQLEGRNLAIHVDAQGNVKIDEAALKSLLRELPALKLIRLEDMLKEFFHHTFLLEGREVSKGDTFEVKGTASLPALTYEIESIDENEVKASLKGKIGPSTSILKMKEEKESDASGVEMVLTGDIRGQASWDRQNGMVNTLTQDYHYQAKLKHAGTEWMMLMTLSSTTKGAVK